MCANNLSIYIIVGGEWGEHKEGSNADNRGEGGGDRPRGNGCGGGGEGRYTSATWTKQSLRRNSSIALGRVNPSSGGNRTQHRVLETLPLPVVPPIVLVLPSILYSLQVL